MASPLETAPKQEKKPRFVLPEDLRHYICFRLQKESPDGMKDRAPKGKRRVDAIANDFNKYFANDENGMPPLDGDQVANKRRNNETSDNQSPDPTFRRNIQRLETDGFLPPGSFTYLGNFIQGSAPTSREVSRGFLGPQNLPKLPATVQITLFLSQLSLIILQRPAENLRLHEITLTRTPVRVSACKWLHLKQGVSPSAQSEGISAPAPLNQDLLNPISTASLQQVITQNLPSQPQKKNPQPRALPKLQQQQKPLNQAFPSSPPQLSSQERLQKQPQYPQEDFSMDDLNHHPGNNYPDPEKAAAAAGLPTQSKREHLQELASMGDADADDELRRMGFSPDRRIPHYLDAEADTSRRFKDIALQRVMNETPPPRSIVRHGRSYVHDDDIRELLDRGTGVKWYINEVDYSTPELRTTKPARAVDHQNRWEVFLTQEQWERKCETEKQQEVERKKWKKVYEERIRREREEEEQMRKAQEGYGGVSGL
ncbi:hypothetical protein MKZ38_008876 [Zalerion maritima]|uniref:Uncharacterized protein n=1 Tax=Zalerion maritima TaxID=339359 RepID=A0AAD5WVD6_9PEZI|nr:hypothetical protein MKZ38_008876 [Zalerion maritima]